MGRILSNYLNIPLLTVSGLDLELYWSSFMKNEQDLEKLRIYLIH